MSTFSRDIAFIWLSDANFSREHVPIPLQNIADALGLPPIKRFSFPEDAENALGSISATDRLVLYSDSHHAFSKYIGHLRGLSTNITIICDFVFDLSLLLHLSNEHTHVQVNKKALSRLSIRSLANTLTRNVISTTDFLDFGTIKESEDDLQWEKLLLELAPDRDSEPLIATSFEREFEKLSGLKIPQSISINNTFELVNRRLPDELSFTILAWNIYGPQWGIEQILQWSRLDNGRCSDRADIRKLVSTLQLALGKITPSELNTINEWQISDFEQAIVFAKQVGNIDAYLVLSTHIALHYPNDIQAKQELARALAVNDKWDEAIEVGNTVSLSRSELVNLRYAFYVSHYEKSKAPDHRFLDSIINSERRSGDELEFAIATISTQCFLGVPDRAVKSCNSAMQEFPKESYRLISILGLRLIATGKTDSLKQARFDRLDSSVRPVLATRVTAALAFALIEDWKNLQVHWQAILENATTLSTPTKINFNSLYYISIIMKILGLEENRQQLLKFVKNRPSSYPLLNPRLDEIETLSPTADFKPFTFAL